MVSPPEGRRPENEVPNMRRRYGFTITELLVAFALIIFIMVILTEAFTAGLQSFRELKALGDMQEKLRACVIIMRRDLMAEHFQDLAGRTRLSDLDLRTQAPPDGGYFRIWQLQVNPPAPTPGGAYTGFPYQTTWCSTLEGTDAGFIPVTRATEHKLAFTVRLRGPLPADWFSAPLPGGSGDAQMQAMCPIDFQTPGTMYSQWAEVVYFLRPVQGRAAGSTPLYALYRRQRLLGQDPYTVSITSAEYPAYSEFSFPIPSGNQTTLNTPTTVTNPENRFGSFPSPNPSGFYNLNGVWAYSEGPQGLAEPRAGEDLLMTNVVSFDVKAIYQGFPQTLNGGANDSPYFGDLPPTLYAGYNPPQNSPYTNSVYSNASASNGYVVFDTWCKTGNYANWSTPNTPNSLPLKVRVLALQITLRVWDDRTGLTRQTSLIQDM